MLTRMGAPVTGDREECFEQLPTAHREKVRVRAYSVTNDGVTGLPPSVTDALHRGQAVVPMDADKRPLVRWKVLQERQPTPDELRRWLREFGPVICGWARVTGQRSGVIVLDDDKAGWFERWGLLPHVRTGSGGHHWIGRHPGWRVRTVNSKSCKKLAGVFPGLDIRGDGGYSLIAGFNTKGGYTWLRDPEPDPLDLLPLEAREFFGLLEAPSPPQRTVRPIPLQVRCDNERPSASLLVSRAMEEARLSGRNNGGFWLAQQLRDNGYSQAEALMIGSDYVSRVWDTNTKGSAETYTTEEYQRTVESAYSQPAREPWERREIARGQLRPLRHPIGRAPAPLVRPTGISLPPPVRPVGTGLQEGGR